MKFKLFLFSSLFLFVLKTNACTCGSWALDLPISEFGLTNNRSSHIEFLSNLVFHGIPLSHEIVEDEIHNNVEAKFKIIKIYKGDFSFDTISVRTPRGSDACGFGCKKEDECLIFCHKTEKGIYYTYSSECCRSISKHYESKRFKNYIDFLETITSMIDGKYDFKQPKAYYKRGYPDSVLSENLIKFEIKNNKFHGYWELMDRGGRLLEKGVFKNGKKVGKWVENYFGQGKDNFFGSTDSYHTLMYRNGVKTKDKLLVQHLDFGEDKQIFEYYRNGKLIKREESVLGIE